MVFGFISLPEVYQQKIIIIVLNLLNEKMTLFIVNLISLVNRVCLKPLEIFLYR